MRQKKSWFAMNGILAVLAIFLMLPAVAGATSIERVLHKFPGSGTTDGRQPWARLIFDASGNLYGTTSQGGGVCSCGTVFKLKPKLGRKLDREPAV